METGVLGAAIKGELNDAHLSTDLKYEEIKKYVMFRARQPNKIQDAWLKRRE
jgi:hypothetical protein